MKQTVLKNINEIISVKNELKGILKAVGVDPGDNFETYPQEFVNALETVEDLTNIILNG